MNPGHLIHIGYAKAGDAVRRRISTRYFTALDKGRLAWLARLAQRIRPAAPFAADLASGAALESLRGHGDILARDPLYRHYASDYLFSAVDPG